MKKKLFLGFCILLCLSGCSRYTELNQLGIVEVLSIEKEEEKKKISISLVLPQKENDTSRNQYKIISESGKSFGEIFLKLQTLEDKKVYFDQTQILLLDQEIVQQEIDHLIPFLLTNLKHPNLLTFLCEDCSAILRKEKEKNFYESLIKRKESKVGTTAITTLEDFASNYLDRDSTAYLPLLKVDNNEIKLTSFMAIKPNQTPIPIHPEDAQILFLLKKKIPSLEETVLISNENISVSISQLQSTIRIKKQEVFIKVSGKYKEKDVLKEKDQAKLKQQLKKNFIKKISSFLQQEQQNQTDLLGIEHLFLKSMRDRKKAQEAKRNTKYHITVDLKKEGDLFDKS